MKSLRAIVSPAGASGVALTWRSSDERVAQIDRGRVTALSAGSAIITCAVSDHPALSAACRVTVLAAPQGGVVQPPETALVYAVPGETAQVGIRFNSACAAYAKLLFDYDESALELTAVEAAGTHVTVGAQALVLAVPQGKIPDGPQAWLTFRVKDGAAGAYALNIGVAECYTIDEISSSLYAAVADTVQAGCDTHIPELIPPVPATRAQSGLSAGWRCAVCGETLTEPTVIPPDRCYWLPSALTALEDGAMAGTPVQQVTVHEGVTSIGASAFSGCASLRVVALPESVTQLGDNAFSGCPQAVLLVPENSAAHRYALEHGLTFALTGGDPASD